MTGGEPYMCTGRNGFKGSDLVKEVRVHLMGSSESCLLRLALTARANVDEEV